MKIKREIVTPYLVFIFIVVALSGMLMFFHLLDDYTNVVHEFLGLAFSLFSILHIMNNWKSVANYSKKQQLIFPGIVILIISSTLIVAGKGKGNLENNIVNKLLKSPVSVSFKVLDVEFESAKKILKQNNINVKNSLQSIEELSRENKKSPQDIVELITKQ